MDLNQRASMRTGATIRRFQPLTHLSVFFSPWETGLDSNQRALRRDEIMSLAASATHPPVLAQSPDRLPDHDSNVDSRSQIPMSYQLDDQASWVCRARTPCTPVLALHAHDLTQRVDYFDEVALRGDDSVDVLVGHRRFIDHANVLAAFDALRYFWSPGILPSPARTDDRQGFS